MLSHFITTASPVYTMCHHSQTEPFHLATNASSIDVIDCYLAGGMREYT